MKSIYAAVGESFSRYAKRISRIRKQRQRRAKLRKDFRLYFNRIVLPFFLSEQKGKAWGYSIVLFCLLLAVSGTNIVLSYLSRDFMSALSAREGDRFWKILIPYLGALTSATLISVAYRFTEERLGLVWRKWLTQYSLKHYFLKRNYYHLRAFKDVDNPDQRIAEDIKNFSGTTLSMVLILINSAMTVISFMAVLASISWVLVLVLFLYSTIGTALSYLIGRRLIKLHNRQYRFEANFRYGLIRIRDNAESVAFFRGEAREKIDLLRRFETVIRNTLSLINWNRNLAFLNSGYNYLALVIPTLIVAPLYFRGEVDFGVITQAQGAFAQVLAAMSVLMTQFERLSAYVAGVSRVGVLWKHLVPDPNAVDENDDPEIQVQEGEKLVVTNLLVQPPRSSRTLISGLNFSLKPGKGLLIMGESGSGKSSILRTIAGLWKSGTGIIQRPRLSDMTFLPQRPYMPPGNLRAQLVYPKRSDNDAVSDDELRGALEKVNLLEILKRVNNDFNAKLDWPNVLSLGEQQRLSFARLILAKPSLAFLDEATSALDEENEKQLYQSLKELGISYVSVGHRSTLRQFHERILAIQADGKWTLEAI